MSYPQRAEAEATSPWKSMLGKSVEEVFLKDSLQV